MQDGGLQVLIEEKRDSVSIFRVTSLCSSSLELMFKINSFFYRRLNNHAEMSEVLVWLFLYISVPYVMRNICRNNTLIVLSCCMCQGQGRQPTCLPLATPWGLSCFCHSPGPLVYPQGHQPLPQWCDSRASLQLPMNPYCLAMGLTESGPPAGSCRSLALACPSYRGGAWHPGLGLPCSCAVGTGSGCQLLLWCGTLIGNLHSSWSQGEPGPCFSLTVRCFHHHTHPSLRTLKITGSVVLTNKTLWGLFADFEGKSCGLAEVCVIQLHFTCTEM